MPGYLPGSYPPGSIMFFDLYNLGGWLEIAERAVPPKIVYDPFRAPRLVRHDSLRCRATNRGDGKVAGAL